MTPNNVEVGMMKPHFTFQYQKGWDTWVAIEFPPHQSIPNKYWPAPVINCTHGADNLDELINEIINWHKKGACKE